jgi:hypothetical protein
MTSKEFVFWMKGFMEACNDYTATPKQWDTIKEKVLEVEDKFDSSVPYNVPKNSTLTYGTTTNTVQAKQLLD